MRQKLVRRSVITSRLSNDWERGSGPTKPIETSVKRGGWDVEWSVEAVLGVRGYLVPRTGAASFDVASDVGGQVYPIEAFPEGRHRFVDPKVVSAVVVVGKEVRADSAVLGNAYTVGLMDHIVVDLKMGICFRLCKDVGLAATSI